MRSIALLHADLAYANVGVTEVGENRGKAVETYQQSCKPPLSPGAPWCAAHVRWRMKQAATQLGTTYPDDFPRSGYCPDWSRYYKANDLWIPAQSIIAGKTIKRPRKGDHALFYFRQLARIAHIGIVYSVDENGVWTVEGNTSPEPERPGDVERDGDGVYYKRREWHELGMFGGFGLLNL